jgi:aspartate 1-decarboxylase
VTGRRDNCSRSLFKTSIRATVYAVHFTLLKSKIHRACVTAANVNYEGSLTISADLAERVGLEEYERILVGNMGNGERFETYVIYGIREQGVIELNGATAYLGKPGDRLTIMSFGLYTIEEARTHQPQIIVVNERNEVLREHRAHLA